MIPYFKMFIPLKLYLPKNKIIKEIEKFKVDEIPENLIEDEVKILSQGMSDEDAKKNRKN